MPADCLKLTIKAFEATATLRQVDLQKCFFFFYEKCPFVQWIEYWFIILQAQHPQGNSQSWAVLINWRNITSSHLQIGLWLKLVTQKWKSSYTEEIKISQTVPKLGLERFLNPSRAINDHRPEGFSVNNEKNIYWLMEDILKGQNERVREVHKKYNMRTL